MQRGKAQGGLVRQGQKVGPLPVKVGPIPVTLPLTLSLTLLLTLPPSSLSSFFPTLSPPPSLSLTHLARSTMSATEAAAHSRCSRADTVSSSLPRHAWAARLTRLAASIASAAREQVANTVSKKTPCSLRVEWDDSFVQATLFWDCSTYKTWTCLDQSKLLIQCSFMHRR